MLISQQSADSVPSVAQPPAIVHRSAPSPATPYESAACTPNGANSAVRKTRKLSLRESIIENMAQQSSATVSTPDTKFVPANDVLGQEKLKIQTMQFSNDIQDRDEQILYLKKREAELAAVLEQKEKIYKQEELVRNQLSYKLQKVLMDKEEAVEKLANLTVSSDSI